MWDAHNIRLSLRDTLVLIAFAPVFGFFASCFGLAVHDALAADYLPVDGGKFGWTSFWLYLVIGVTAMLGTLMSFGAMITATDYWHDDATSVIAAFMGMVILPFSAFAIIGLAPEPGINFDTFVALIGLGLPLVGLAAAWAHVKFAHIRLRW